MRGYRFRPRWVPTLATLAVLPLLVQLGLWQWHKGQGRLELQRRMESLATAPPVEIGSRLLSGEGLRHRRVVLRGDYDPGHQFLLDNQVLGGRAGFHVLTPLRIEGGEMRVLVNRGWVPLGRSRSELPAVAPPPGRVEVTGTVWVPGVPKSVPPVSGLVWEGIDLARYRERVPFPLQPFAVRLEPGEAGCYACDWPRPDERAGVNLGYALQWFGMAGVLVGFYLYASLVKDEG